MDAGAGPGGAPGQVGGRACGHVDDRLIFECDGEAIGGWLVEEEIRSVDVAIRRPDITVPVLAKEVVFARRASGGSINNFGSHPSLPEAVPQETRPALARFGLLFESPIQSPEYELSPMNPTSV